MSFEDRLRELASNTKIKDWNFAGLDGGTGARYVTNLRRDSIIADCPWSYDGKLIAYLDPTTATLLADVLAAARRNKEDTEWRGDDEYGLNEAVEALDAHYATKENK